MAEQSAEQSAEQMAERTAERMADGAGGEIAVIGSGDGGCIAVWIEALEEEPFG